MRNLVMACLALCLANCAALGTFVGNVTSCASAEASADWSVVKDAADKALGFELNVALDKLKSLESQFGSTFVKCVVERLAAQYQAAPSARALVSGPSKLDNAKVYLGR